MRSLASSVFALGFGMVWILAGCGSSADSAPAGSQQPQGQAVEAVFEVPASLDALADDAWFNHPWPSDFRVNPDGSIHLLGYYNHRGAIMVNAYIQAMQDQIVGFSPAASGFLRFTGPIDPAALPAGPVEATQPDAPVQLIDVDAASPDKGKRRLLSLHWRAEEGAYWVTNTLAFMPALGYPLRASTRYALLVTDKVKAADGTALHAAANVKQVLGLETAATTEISSLRDRWAESLKVVADAGVALEHVVHLTVFTTGAPAAETARIAKDAREAQPAPTVDAAAWKLTDQMADFDLYEGVYGPSPDYQAGNPPFQKPADGGGFAFDAQGAPIKQREFNPRFALAVPKVAQCPMPASGYPIVMYAHGTGGDYLSFVSGGTAKSLAKVCLASMGVDQIMHPARVPPETTTGPELLFFNFENVVAARTNPRQSAIDEVARGRLARESGIRVPATVSATQAELVMDGTRVLFYGHSQGGLNGPLYMAVDATARGGVLSGSGSMISITLLEKTKPDPGVAQMVRSTMLHMYPPEYEELSIFHPAISLSQTIIDVADPIHYVPMILSQPIEGFSPKSIYQTEGVNADGTGDNYTPPHAIEVQAVATGLPIMEPVIHPIEEMAWAGLPSVAIPTEGLPGNLAGGKASGVLAQWPASKATDGHFVVSQIAAASTQAAKFCRNLADDPAGRVPAP
jgi:hypothetical protein